MIKTAAATIAAVLAQEISIVDPAGVVPRHQKAPSATTGAFWLFMS